MSTTLLVVFDDMVAGMISNSPIRISPMVTELFIRGRKLSISLNFVTLSYFIPKGFTIKSTHYFTMKIANRRELQQIAIN